MSPRARRRIAILGSTGSIGRQAIDVASSHPDRFEVVALAAGRNRDVLEDQARSLGVRHFGLGAERAVELATLDEVDVVLNAIVGAAGLRASLSSLEAGKSLALANKESLVAGGSLCVDAAKRGGGTIVPVDSEHAGLAQCLQGRRLDEVARIVLTASGGPFREREDLESVTVDEALAHPTWSMGRKISIDSATLMNKGLEVIEAHWLFGIGYDRIGVIVHPQSIVHGLVELIDGSTILQAAPTDMRIPIGAALAAPAPPPSSVPPVDLGAVGALEFVPEGAARFPCLRLAYEAGRSGDTYPAALNAANEVAVDAFLAGKLSFTAIAQVVEHVLDHHRAGDARNLEAVLEVDEWARREAGRLVERGAGAGTHNSGAMLGRST